MKSSSSLKALTLCEKVRQGLALASMHLKRNWTNPIFNLDVCFEEYEAVLARYGRPSLERSRVLEIGFGARPFRLVWLYNSGVDVWGVDLDKPLLRLSLQSLVEVIRQNGTERALKSLVRCCISDKTQWKQMASELRGKGRSFTVPEERLIVADATSANFWTGVQSVDFIYAEDVLEHIPRERLANLVEQMAKALQPSGVALLRPMTFTGICGGHHLEWYPHTFRELTNRRTEPWEHLRQDRWPASTYLNRLSRKDYVDLFEKHFRILENEPMSPDLGAQFMTNDIRAELSQYSDDELFSNSVRFVLEPK
jgi:SAM-dependent methyltransferase